jgi:type II secretory pathway pseudopilin PulG
MNRTGQAGDALPGRTATPSYDDAGYIMVALLVAMAVTAVWMGAALPAWRQQVQREKEAELIFRGEAIARAIYLYRQKNGQNLPPNLDTLVSQRYLRKKYIDPITGEDFLPIAGATAAPATPTAAGIRS